MYRRVTEIRTTEKNSSQGALHFVVLAVWAAAVVTGFSALMKYEGAAAPMRAAPVTENSFATGDKPSLVLALHPKCPCSAATVSELLKIYSHAPDAFGITVLAYKPAREETSWIETQSVEEVRKLSARVVVDEDGAEARRLGMTTSGQILLYDRSGKLLYNGGITGARGHRGDNAGAQTVLELIRGGAPQGGCSPVFGCSLFEGTL